ncbi:hypothetical protein CFOL_v3_00485 [Cephalotus follicularis]|uniref:Uncharacterized protein n=1 Tax=Cephalotus follicularis TaxID=3775 RepID=A0A1Q3AMG1_CEPFO|nr:hypothetical protein CFOL_v3_00485 [Cephalotus follicularis]
MAGCAWKKLKRKDIEDVNDDFSDFSLSSPARKIRRLGVELPPIMEEEDPEMLPPLFQDRSEASVVDPAPAAATSTQNPERALVLFKPINANMNYPSTFTVSVDSEIISGLKGSNKFLWSRNFSHLELAEDDKAKHEQENKCLAVVPWVCSQPSLTPGMQLTQREGPEFMDSDDSGEATMDIEDINDASVGQDHANECDGIRAAEGLHQWHQQHCMIPHLPHHTSTPITWFR